MQGCTKLSRWINPATRHDRRRAALESLERRELLSGQPPLIADAAPYNAAFVQGVYHDALARPADSAAAGFLTEQLDQGLVRGDVPSLVLQSNEYLTNLVQAAYQQYLGRSAEPQAITIWTRLLQTGAHDEQLAAALVASAEFYAHAGGNDAAWIAEAYQALLGRAATASDLDTFAGLLASGISRETVALHIAYSPEHEARVVTAEYEHYIDAAPDAAGLEFWSTKLATSQSTAETLAIDLMCGDGYFEQQTGVPPSVVPVPYQVSLWQQRNAQVTIDAMSSTAPVLFIGDSITQLWQSPTGQSLWNQYFAPLNALDAGVTGDSTETLLWRVQSGQLNALSPKVIVLMVGINNIILGDSPQDVAEGVAADIAALRQHFSSSKIVLLGILPATLTGYNEDLLPSIAATNQLLAPMADNESVFYLDFWPAFTNADGSYRPELHVADGVHLNAAGYAVLVPTLAPEVNRLLSGP